MNYKLFLQKIVTSNFYFTLFVKPRIRSGFIETKFGKVSVKNQSSFILSLIGSGIYERKEIMLVNKYLLPDLDVIELGSSIGLVSLAIAKKTKKRVYSIEANPKLFQNLLVTKKANNLHSLTFINAAISYSSSSEVPFLIDERNLGSKIQNSEDSIRIGATTIGKVIQEHSIDEFALVSDIEGAEIDFILNEDVLLMQKCRQIIIELHDTCFMNSHFSTSKMADLIKEKFNMKLIDQKSSVWVFTKN